ncbi:MAG: 4-hydroxyphenylacetate decarboxylase small subunit [Lentimicrobiaceae bacterium]|jgi:hypothetical protein|nr:4-hydroxyphenylacetate decarboxylase small subunit [Lentimicrobiaceae bacterium]
MENAHKNCRFYLPVDAFKGFCKRDKNRINADDSCCENFERAKQCQSCAYFDHLEEFSGKCMQRFFAYPDMNALTCSDFKWLTQKN